MSLLRLRLAMIGTMAFLIAVSTLFFTVLLSLAGGLSLFTLLFFVIGFNILQWLIAPYMIGALYSVREIPANQYPELHSIIVDLSRRLGIGVPRLMLADVPMPNAFAYGSPLTGSKIAVTSGLLKTLELEEVEAVLGHELSHIKHRDVQIMMVASVLPAIFYYIGYSFMLQSWFGGNRRNGGGGGAVLIGFGSMLMYWLLSLFVLRLSRLREYYADRGSVSVVQDGARKLSEGLAKIAASTGRLRRRVSNDAGINSFKALMIADPDRAARDAVELGHFSSDQQLVRELMTEEITFFDRLMELFSTHPNLKKRLLALRNLH